MKKVFFACAAILCLALAFYFGAMSAQGQGNSFFQVIGPAGFVRVGDTIYNWQYNPEHWTTWTHLPPVPPSSLVYLTTSMAITDSGEGWVYLGTTWQSFGFIPGGSTSVIDTSWGKVKAKYR